MEYWNSFTDMIKTNVNYNYIYSVDIQTISTASNFLCLNLMKENIDKNV